MAITLTQIRTGLATNLQSLIGTSELQVSAYMLANPTPPTIHLYPGGQETAIEYDLAFGRGLDRWSFTVQAFVPLSSADTDSQQTLDAYIAPAGAQSVKAALESDSTLGGLVANVNVVSCTGYRVYVREGGTPVLGAEWLVEVLATGK